MTVMEFFGCGFLAFGPPLAMFSFTIARYPMRIIILMASAFCWLLSFLLSSLLWFAVVPLRDTLAFGLICSVLFQEWFRYLIYKLLCKAEGGLKKVTDTDSQFSNNKHVLAYVCGLGFGIMSGAFALVNVLAESIGPGTMGLKGGSDLFFVTSAATTLALILLNTFWGVIGFYGLANKNYLLVAWVLGSHMLLSCLTLLNRELRYAETLISAYTILAVTAVIAFNVAGGTRKSLKASLVLNPSHLDVYEEIP